jgi:hypothetical protein
MLTGLCDSIARKAPLGAIEISAGMSRRKRLTGLNLITCPLLSSHLPPLCSLFELRSCNHHTDLHSPQLRTLQQGELSLSPLLLPLALPFLTVSSSGSNKASTGIRCVQRAPLQSGFLIVHFSSLHIPPLLRETTPFTCLGSPQLVPLGFRSFVRIALSCTGSHLCPNQSRSMNLRLIL